jgi:hypothetical protein
MAKEAEAECAEYRTRLEDYSDYDEVRRSEMKMGAGGGLVLDCNQSISGGRGVVGHSPIRKWRT